MLKAFDPRISTIYYFLVLAYNQNNASAKITTSMTPILIAVAITSIRIPIPEPNIPT